MWIKIANVFISVVMIVSSILRVDLGYGMKPKRKTVDLEGYKLVWQAEFEGDELDRSKWNDNQNVNTLHWGAVRKDSKRKAYHETFGDLSGR